MIYVVSVQSITLLSLAAYAFFKVVKKNKVTPIDDIGIIWILLWTIYSVLPALVWLVQGGEYSIINVRHNLLGTTPEDIVYLLNLSIVCLLGFIAAYFLFLSNNNFSSIKEREIISIPLMLAAIIIILINFLIGVFFGEFSIVPKSSSYIESYEVSRNLPLGIKQISKIFSGFDFIAALVLTTALIQRYKTHKFLFFAVVFFYIFINIGGSRSGLIFYLYAFLILWHVYVANVSQLKFYVLGFSSLLLFLFVGVIRNLSGGDLFFSGVGEFDQIWANAVEILHDKEMGDLQVPIAARFSDFYGFIPSQLLWFEKEVLSIWFMERYYPSFYEAGHGMAFGMLSEFIVGYGMIEAIAKGFMLGSVAAFLMNYFRKAYLSWWMLPFQLSLLVGLVVGIRDTSFHVLVDVIQLSIPALLVMFVISKVLSAPHDALNSKVS